MPVPTPPTTPSTPPLAPQRVEPTTFSARMDAWLSWFNSSFWVWVYDLVPWIQARANETEAWSNSASASAAAAGVSQTVAAEATATATSAITVVTQQAAAAAATSASISSVAAATSTSASSAAAASAAAASYRDQAVQAWAAASAPSEQLAAQSASLHYGAVVKAIVYDTSKDSDGGAWRKRCNDKSWYSETLGGDRWLGQQATIAAAWTAAGSTTGAIFQASATAGPLTIGKYYAATSNTTATEVFRGISREFPAVAGIVAEASRVVIYDLTQSGAPMWMVFIQTVNSDITDIWRAGRNALALAAKDGMLLIGLDSSTGVGGLIDIRFLNDSCARHITGVSFGVSGRKVADRNLVAPIPGKGIYTLVNGTVNDVAITVLDTAPADPATGLPVPTIAVATAGGVSVIRDTGSVESTVSSSNVSKVWIDDKYFRAISQTRIACAAPIGTALPAGGASHLNQYWTALNYYEGSIPATAPIATSVSCVIPKAIGSGVMLTQIKENPATPAKGMVAYITNAYNTGWQVGDSRLAALADTVAETISATNLVTNGTFATDTSGWVAEGGATLSVESGELRVLGNGSTPFPIARFDMTLVVGKMYQVKFSITTANTLGITLIGETLYPSTGAGYYYPTAIGDYVVYFIATNATRSLRLVANTAGTVANNRFDNVSCNLCVSDRSVKAKGLVINGTLTKTAVASGANLVAHSGFTNLNYLEQPYNSQLDFGTGDFCIMGWLKVADVAAATSTVFSRGLLGNFGGILCNVNSDGALELFANSDIISPAAAATTYPSSGHIKNDVWNLVEFGRASNYAYIRLNGRQLVSTLFTDNITYVGATSRLGTSVNNLNYAYYASMALWRISTTAPSADQIAHIYRTELPLFQPNAQCTIAGTSTAVTALAYDETTDELHVGTSWGRSEFRDLLRVYSEATTTGAITTLAASEGVVVTGGTSAKVYAPAMNLRDELRRKDIARKALGRIPAFFDYTATASQTAFVAPKGFTVKALYKNGTLMRETTTGTYWTRSSDGFQETATLSVGASVSDWISIMCVRS